MRTELVIRFDYGTSVPWVFRLDDGALCAIAGPDMLVLRASVPVHGEDLKTVGDFWVGAGETVTFDLTHSASHLSPPGAIDPDTALSETETFWQCWSDQLDAAGPWTDVVKRSLIVLKALTYRPTGGIVAAPTTSLPEQLGGVRNWDYRYCWLRDSTLTLLALMEAGHGDEAKAWHNWLQRAVAGSPSQSQIMYGLAGERRLTEWEIPWLPGYEEVRSSCRRTMLASAFSVRIAACRTASCAWASARSPWVTSRIVWSMRTQQTIMTPHNLPWPMHEHHCRMAILRETLQLDLTDRFCNGTGVSSPPISTQHVVFKSQF
jgi:hypothetical protein